MKKKHIVLTIILSSIMLMFVGLNFSDRFNKFIFSSVINPYDPLVSSVPITDNSQLKTLESKFYNSEITQLNDSQIDDTQMTNKENESHYYWQDPRGLFPIFAYNVPDFTNDYSKSLKIIEKGGINIIINGNMGWMPAPNIIKEAFEKLENSQLRWMAIIENECKSDFIYRNSTDEINSNIKPFLELFNDDFVYGWYIWDEPGGNRKLCTLMNLEPNNDNEDINRMTIQIRSDSSFNQKLDLVNLFPTYWDGTPDSASYEKYIDAFVSSQEYKPKVLSVDHYTLLKTEFGSFRTDYYLNLDIIRKKSLEYDIPFWMAVLSSGHLDYKDPSFSEISLQVYSALAYGAKGIGYYLYSKSWEKVGYTSWILENFIDNESVADSLHGPFYLPVKRLNGQIQILGKTLLNLESVEVIHSSDYPNKQKNISGSILNAGKPNIFIKRINKVNDINSDPKVLLGILKDRSIEDSTGSYLLAVNKDAINNVKIDIIMQNILSIFEYGNNNGNRTFIKQSDTLNTNILPGSGKLFYVE